MLRHDVVQGLVHIHRHAAGIAADVEMRPLLQPAEQFGPLLPHAILHVNFTNAVAGPGRRQLGQGAGGEKPLEFVPVEKVRFFMPMAEEQPGLAAGSGGHPLLQKGAERSDPGTGPDHNDRCLAVCRQGKAVGFLDTDRQGIPCPHPFGQKTGSHALACPPSDVVTHGIDRQGDLRWVDARTGGNRVEPRLQRIQNFDQSLGIRLQFRRFLQGTEDIERVQVSVRILSFGHRQQFIAHGLVVGQGGQQPEQVVRGRTERNVLDQGIAEAPGMPVSVADLAVGGNIEVPDDGVGERRIVRGVDPQAVSHLVRQAAGFEGNLDVAGFLVGTGPGQPRSAGERPVDGPVPGTQRLLRFVRLLRGERRSRVTHFLVEPFQHAQGLLAAGNAQVELAFLSQEQGIGVVFTGIAALTAVLLPHGGHHAAAQRPAFRQFHAFVDGQGLVVPQGLAVVAVIQGIGGGRLLPVLVGGRGFRLQAEYPGEEPVQPGPLLIRERGVFGDQGSWGRHDSTSVSFLRASISWRLVNAWKESSGPFLCAR